MPTTLTRPIKPEIGLSRLARLVFYPAKLAGNCLIRVTSGWCHYHQTNENNPLVNSELNLAPFNTAWLTALADRTKGARGEFSHIPFTASFSPSPPDSWKNPSRFESNQRLRRGAASPRARQRGAGRLFQRGGYTGNVCRVMWRFGFSGCLGTKSARNGNRVGPRRATQAIRGAIHSLRGKRWTSGFLWRIRGGVPRA